MNFPVKAALLGVAGIIAAVSLGLNLANQSNAGEDSKPLGKQELTEMVREILLENPDMIVDALDAYSADQSAQEERAIAQKLAKHRPALLSAENGFAYGASDETREVVVVELFDYHCGFCKKAADFVHDLPETEKGVQIILRELPILRDESNRAAEASLAAREQGKYFDFHWAMMGSKGVLTDGQIANHAQSVGLDIERLKKDSSSEAVTNAILETYDIARDIGVTGTPTFIVLSVEGDFARIIGGYDPDGVIQAIKDARASQK